MKPENFHQAEKIKSGHAALYTQHIMRSLVECPLLLQALPEASQFPQGTLTVPQDVPPLSFRQKLGHLYEDALTRLLESSERYDLISNSIQIQSAENITLGELDYLLKDTETGKIIHLELAIKFYLAHEQNGKLTYPGPNARDNYYRKLKRLREHQLQLASSSEARKLLNERFGIDSFETQQFVHGIFFFHHGSTDRSLPAHTTSDCRTRDWLYCHELKELLGNEYLIKVIPKPLWLCEPDPAWLDTLDDISLTELKNIAQQRCTMIHSPAFAGPVFVAPDLWPQQ